jgi:hypothetical protein
MDIYDNNTSIRFMTPELINLLKWVFIKHPQTRVVAGLGEQIKHANVIDVHPDEERVRIICNEVPSIECLSDQLAFVSNARILTVYVSGFASEIRIDNTTTKIILVVGNVQNIRLTNDDSDTIVFHRTFEFEDEKGIVIGDEYSNLKPKYYPFDIAIKFPEAFDLVRQFGITYAGEHNRKSLQAGNGYSYIIDTEKSLNSFRDAKTVAIMNNSTLDPEILNTNNLLILHGKPSDFKGLQERESRGEVLLADMSQEETKSFIEHRAIKGFDHETTANEGFSRLDDYLLGISPARGILRGKVPDERLDDLCFQIDNPFVFAYVKQRNPDNYQLYLLSVIENLGADVGAELQGERLSVLLQSHRSCALDEFHLKRYRELKRGSAPLIPFQKEYPRIDPFAIKKSQIRNETDGWNQLTETFFQQAKNYTITIPGNYQFQNKYFVQVWVYSNSELYIRDCGLVMVHCNDSSIKCCLHIVGKAHTIIASNCEVQCYFKQDEIPEDYLFCTEEIADDVGMCLPDLKTDLLLSRFKANERPRFGSLLDQATRMTSLTNSDYKKTQIKHLICNKSLIRNSSLCEISQISNLP